ncbi:MAG: hypothetical protein ABI036_20265, partial [Fibrobacteria bacterium]
MGTGEVPRQCPLIVPITELHRYPGTARYLPPSQLVATAHRGGGLQFAPRSITPSSSPHAVFLMLARTGHLHLLAFTFNNSARKNLEAWQGARHAYARRRAAELSTKENEGREMVLDPVYIRADPA